MIENVTVQKARSYEPPVFEVEFFDLEKKGQKGYFRTIKYGNETEMRELLKSCGVPAAEIDHLFEAAKR